MGLVAAAGGWSRIAAQEGRPALAAETAEDLRVLTAIHDAFPHDWDGWVIEGETKLEGATHFHDSGEAVRRPFRHEYKIEYAIDLKSSEAQRLREALEKAPDSMDLMAGSRVEVARLSSGC
jgi:hypothetical protein